MKNLPTKPGYYHYWFDSDEWAVVEVVRISNRLKMAWSYGETVNYIDVGPDMSGTFGKEITEPKRRKSTAEQQGTGVRTGKEISQDMQKAFDAHKSKTITEKELNDKLLKLWLEALETQGWFRSKKRMREVLGSNA